MTSIIGSIIDKKDNFEIIRDKIAEILFVEISNQKQLLENNFQDSSLLDCDVFCEKTDPHSKFIDHDDNYKKGIINVFFESCDLNASQSNNVNQVYTAQYNIDCYGHGYSKQHPEYSDGHIIPDREAAMHSHALTRIVRNILHSDLYRCLGSKEIVRDRKINSFRSYQPQPGQNTITNILATRINLSVNILETTPEYEYDNIEAMGLKIMHLPSGQVVFDAEYKPKDSANALNMKLNKGA